MARKARKIKTPSLFSVCNPASRGAVIVASDKKDFSLVNTGHRTLTVEKFTISHPVVSCYNFSEEVLKVESWFQRNVISKNAEIEINFIVGNVHQSWLIFLWQSKVGVQILRHRKRITPCCDFTVDTSTRLHFEMENYNFQLFKETPYGSIVFLC